MRERIYKIDSRLYSGGCCNPIHLFCISSKPEFIFCCRASIFLFPNSRCPDRSSSREGSMLNVPGISVDLEILRKDNKKMI